MSDYSDCESKKEADACFAQPYNKVVSDLDLQVQTWK